MNGDFPMSEARSLRRVLILADESAAWRVAGLRQLDRLALSLQEFARARGAMDVCVLWEPSLGARAAFPLEGGSLSDLNFVRQTEDFLQDERGFDLVVSTRIFLYRDSLPTLLAHLSPVERNGAREWSDHAAKLNAALPAANEKMPWQYLARTADIPECERTFLRRSGKSQDGLVSRHLNRRISRRVSRWLLQLPVTPSRWSVLIFVLPLLASFAFLRGSYAGFIIGCAVFQLYSILDGCDGEIARAKFLQTEFGRRLDSFLDLVGNLMLALTLGLGLARHAHSAHFVDGYYVIEGIATAVLIALSEGIVFVRRTRSPVSQFVTTKWNGALYQRHHEFLERSGILIIGERLVFWLVQLTKRDMAMLAFLVLAIVGWPQVILHLLFLVAAINSALASNAYLRPVAPRLASETT